MSTTDAGDIDIYYKAHGEGGPLVQIIGYGGHIGNWFGLIPLLSREYCVIVFDNRGTGSSDKPDIPHTMEMMAGDTTGLLDTVGIDTAHIFCVSMGGCIAQQFTLLYLCGSMMTLMDSSASATSRKPSPVSASPRRWIII